MRNKFQPGQPKPPNSGRQTGVGNKRKFKKVSQWVAENGIDPVQKILEVINRGGLKDKEEVDAWALILSYCQGKPKDEPADEEVLADLSGVPTEKLLSLVLPDEKP